MPEQRGRKKYFGRRERKEREKERKGSNREKWREEGKRRDASAEICANWFCQTTLLQSVAGLDWTEMADLCILFVDSALCLTNNS